MRELRVEDALLYLDQVKVEFGDRPHIYNEFLDIMKTFKTQQIDTLEVIHRVSTLFQGNRRLVLGFNTFLPEGYKIEIPEDGHGPQVPVYRVPGSNATHSLQDTIRVGVSAPASSIRIPPQQPNVAASSSIQPSVNRALPTRVEPPYPAVSVGVAAPNLPATGTPSMGFAPPDSVTNTPRAPLSHALQTDPGSVGSRPPTQALDSTSSLAPVRHGQVHHPPQPLGGVAIRAPEQMSTIQSSQQKPPPPPPPPQQQQQRGNRPAADVKALGMGRGQRPGTIPPGPSPKRPLEVPKGSMFDQQSPSQPRPPLQSQQPPQQHVGLPPQPVPQNLPKPQKQPQKQPQQPLEFDHAINYVTTIKRRFASDPETYKKFLEILHTYQKEQRGIKEVLDDVSNLFEDHPDLLKEFTYFLPDAVQAQAKAQLDAVAKEAEARKQKKAKEAIMVTAQTMQQHIKTVQDPNQRSAPNATQARSTDRDSSIIRRVNHGKVSFEPMRPPRKNALTPSQAAARFGRPVSVPEAPKAPNNVETSFFQRAKEHLNRKELAADKPAGSRRHTPWSEFVKCLHLFGVGILNREELLLLLKGLFVVGHTPKTGANAGSGNTNPSVIHDATELMKDFEDILIGRGPYSRQESLIKDKSKYGTLRTRDFDFGNCENPTPSYWSYPGDFPKQLFLSHPGQTSDDAKFLNEKLFCVSRLFDDNGDIRHLPTIEDSIGSRARHNICEAMMFRIEDERYELDMAIERNVRALGLIEPLADEAKSLREQEENDGQPIGRLRYRLNRGALNSIHINAIGRIYGDRGDEVIQLLLRNPLVCLPIIYQRLKQKQEEWGKAKIELTERWRYLQESNYEGSLDVQFYYNHRELEATFSLSSLKKQCERVRSFIKHPEKLVDHTATIRFKPSFGTRLSDFGAVWHQPYLETKCDVNLSHKLALELLSAKVKSNGNVSSLDRERIGRIWAEFLVPWFEYPTYWVTSDVRESFGGKLTSTMVKYVPGQRVKTIVGEGTILSFLPDSPSAAPRYRVRLDFGTAFLCPSAVFYAIPVKEAPYFRLDGIMVRDETYMSDDDSLDTDKLDKRYKLIFCTEVVYLFFRLYNLLCLLLADSIAYAESFGPLKDPASFYRNPQKKGIDNEFSRRLNMVEVCMALKKVIKKQMSFRDYVSFGRKVCRDRLHQLAVLPKLVEKCSDFLIKMAREDIILQLYDYCHYDEVDPVAVRNQCLAVTPEAIYRIQYDSESRKLFYCYLPESEALLSNPRTESENVDDESKTKNIEDKMEEDNVINDNAADAGQPAAKRLKLK